MRVSEDFPAAMGHEALFVPQDLPLGEITLQPPKAPTYLESDVGSKVAGGHSMPSRSESDRKKDREAELRAVKLATEALQTDGWTLTGDRQNDGVGYDLEFDRHDERLHVEVKGVQGARLTFNITPKEAWRAETDERFVIVVVTSVLSPFDYDVHLLTRADLAVAARVVTGYRLTCN